MVDTDEVRLMRDLLPAAVAPRMDAGDRISAHPLGLLQRTDDDVSSGAGIGGPSIAARGLGRMEADPVRLRRNAVHRVFCAVVRASILAGLV